MEIKLDYSLTVDEFLEVVESVGWKTYSKQQAKKALENTMYAVSVKVDGDIAGIGRVVGDNSIVCILTDICVKPKFQGMGIGSMIVRKLKQLIENSVKPGEKMQVELTPTAGNEELYKKAGIKGGHVILLNGHDSPYYESTKEQAILALHTYPGGLQIGGGVNSENAGEYLSAGASHVIVTSYVFKDGRISWENLNKMKETVGKEKLVLDLSCRRKDGKYYIVTDRWQKFTDVTVTLDIMKELGSYCDEFLVHAVDVEGKARGVETELASLLGEYKGNPVTYAGGVGSMKDIEDLRKYGKDRLDVTVGSALDLFGGNISFSELIKL